MSQHSSDQDENQNDGSNNIQFESVLLSTSPDLRDHEDHQPRLNQSFSSSTLDKSILSYTEHGESGDYNHNHIHDYSDHDNNNQTDSNIIPQFSQYRGGLGDEDINIETHPIYRQLLAQFNALQTSYKNQIDEKNTNIQKNDNEMILMKEIERITQENTVLNNDLQLYRNKMTQAIQVIKDLKLKQQNNDKIIKDDQEKIHKLQEENHNLKKKLNHLSNNNNDDNVIIPLDLPSPIMNQSSSSNLLNTPKNNNNSSIFSNLFDNNNDQISSLSLPVTPQTPSFTPSLTSSISTPIIRSNNNSLIDKSTLTSEQQLELITKLENTLNELKLRYNNVKDKYKILYTSYQKLKSERIEENNNIEKENNKLNQIFEKDEEQNNNNNNNNNDNDNNNNNNNNNNDNNNNNNNELQSIIQNNEYTINKYKEQIQEFENNKEENTTKCDNFNKRIISLQNTQENHLNLIRKYELQLTNNNNNKTDENLAEKNKIFEETIEKMRNDYSIKESDYNILKQQYDSLHVTYSSLLSDYDELKSDCTIVKSKHSTLSTQYDNINKEYNDIKSKHSLLLVNYDELKSECNDIKLKHSSLLLNYNILDKTNHDNKQYIDKLQNDINAVEVSNNTTESIARELQQHILEKINLNKKYNLLEKLYENTINDYKNEINMIKEEYKNDIDHINKEKVLYLNKLDDKMEILKKNQHNEILKINDIITIKDNDISLLQSDINRLNDNINKLNQDLINNEEHYHNIIINKENYLQEISLQYNDKEVGLNIIINDLQERIEYLSIKCYEYEVLLVENQIDIIVSPNNNLINNDNNNRDNTKTIKQQQREQQQDENKYRHEQQQQQQLQQQQRNNESGGNNHSNSQPTTPINSKNNQKNNNNNNTQKNNNNNENNDDAGNNELSSLFKQQHQHAMYKKETNVQQQLHKATVIKLLKKNINLIHKIKNLKKYIFFLTKQLEIFIISKKRNLIDVDYLKNVLVRYIQFERLGLRSERQAMVSVIGNLLHFTKDDYKTISFQNNLDSNSNASSPSGSSSQWGSWLFGGSGGGGNNTNDTTNNNNLGKSYSAATNHDFDTTGCDPMSVLQGKTTIRSKTQQQGDADLQEKDSDVMTNNNNSSMLMSSTAFVSTRNKRNNPPQNKKNDIDHDEEYLNAMKSFVRLESSSPSNNQQQNIEEQEEECSPFDLNGNIVKIKSLLPPVISDKDLVIDLDEFGIEKGEIFDDDEL